jgi:hypothetical protein
MSVIVDDVALKELRGTVTDVIDHQLTKLDKLKELLITLSVEEIAQNEHVVKTVILVKKV